MKTITKISIFVIAVAFLAGCGLLDSLADSITAEPEDEALWEFDPPVVIGKIKSSELEENSGLTVSRCREEIIWTHNDSGGGPYVFAIDTKGSIEGVWKVPKAKERDWEDIASARIDGKCYLFIGDIGDNDKKRNELHVYKIPEPSAPAKASRKRKDALAAEDPEVIRISYPDGKHNAEALLIHPTSLDLYIVTKARHSKAKVFKLTAQEWRSAVKRGKKARMSIVTEIALPAFMFGSVTGGEISPDGKRVALSDYVAAYEYSLPEDSKDFDKIWERAPSVLETGPREQGESISYSQDGNMLFLSSEKVPAPLIVLKRR